MGIISYAQNFEDVLLWRALGHIQQGCYIDIGAHDPIVDSVSKAFYEHGWRGIHLEPLPVYCDALRRDRPDETVLQAAVAAETGVLRFFEIPDTGISTGDEAIAQSHRERGFRINEITVPCVTLAQVFQLVKGDVVHWLKIDVEGLEKQVLQGWGESPLRPWIVVVESILPLTQEEVYSAWEGLLIAKGYRCVHFDGLNRYYLAEGQPGLENAFRSGPNIFDSFQFSGTASNPFWGHVAQSIRNELGGQIESLKQQSFLHQSSERNCAMRLEDEYAHSEQLKRALQAEQAANLQNQNAAKALALQFEQQARRETEAQLRNAMQREQEFTAELLAAKDQLQQLEQACSGREQQLQEQLVQATLQSRQELEAQLRAATQREQEFTAQLLAAKEQLQQLEQARSAREQQLQEQLAHAEQQSRQEIEAQLRRATQREQEFTVQLLAGRAHLQQLDNELRNRQCDFLERLAEIERQSRLESEAQFRKVQESEQAAAEQLLALQQQAAQALARQASELQSQHEELKAAWATKEKALSQEIEDLTNEMQTLRHASELQTQKHSFVMDAHLAEHQTLIEAYVALESRLKAEIEAEHQTNMRLCQALAEVQQVLAETYASFTWRLTSPLRTLASLLTQNKNKTLSSVKVSEPITLEHLAHITTKLSSITVNQASLEKTMHPLAPVTSSKASKATVAELLEPLGQQFIYGAYLALLGREPDPEGMNYYLGRLRVGVPKIQILAQLSRSSEGNKYAAKIDGMEKEIRRYEYGQLPFIGWLFRLIWKTEGNSSIERNMRRLENQVYVFSVENSKNFIQVEQNISMLQIRLAQNSQKLFGQNALEDENVADLASISSSEEETSIIRSNNVNLAEKYSELTPRAREIYFELKTGTI